MHTVLKTAAGIGAALGLLASSAASAAAAVPAAFPASYQAPDAWMMLSVLSPTSATTLGSATAAAQPADVPPPPPPGPPPPPPTAGGPMSGGAGELIPFALWFGLIAVALTITDTEGRNQSTGSPNSAP